MLKKRNERKEYRRGEGEGEAEEYEEGIQDEIRERTCGKSLKA
jgi:hypothetical protein